MGGAYYVKVKPIRVSSGLSARIISTINATLSGNFNGFSARAKYVSFFVEVVQLN